MMFRVLVSVVLAVVVTLLFKRLAGSLSIRRLNLVSVTYYVYIIMVYAGAAFAYCGFVDGHYLIKRLTQSDIDMMFAAVVFAGFGLGVIFFLIESFANDGKWSNAFDSFYDSDAFLGIEDSTLFAYVVICSCLGLFSTVYSFSSLGSIPVIDAITGNIQNAANARWAASHAFPGVVYVRNIGMLMLVPLSNFMSFACWRITKSAHWCALFALTGVLTLFALTWNLEKSPIAMHAIYLFVLACLIDFRPSSLQTILIFCCAGALVLIGYTLTSGSIGSISLETGPISRLITTPAGALGMHFRCFPGYHDYLGGASLQGYWSFVFDLEETGLRSGAVVMQYANPAGVASNEAGVMNAFFIGEAYANWGVLGIVVSVIAVGLVIGVLHNYIIRRSKTFFSVMAYCVLVKFHVTTMMGGIVDYMSIASLLPFIIVLLPLLFGGIRKAG